MKCYKGMRESGCLKEKYEKYSKIKDLDIVGRLLFK
jgi:hypothetical protein